MKTTLLLLLCLAAAAADSRSDAPAPPHGVITGDIVAFSAFGVVGTRTAMMRLVDAALASGKDAEPLLVELAGSNAVENVLYALHGLKALRSPHFASLSANWKDDLRLVRYSPGGCRLGSCTVAELVQGIAAEP